MAYVIIALAAAATTSDISLFPLPKNFSSTPGCLDFDPATFNIDFDAGATPTAAGKLLLAAVTRYRSIVLSDTQNPSAYCKCSDDAAASRTLILVSQRHRELKPVRRADFARETAPRAALERVLREV